jgi:hypothetical protein
MRNLLDRQEIRHLPRLPQTSAFHPHAEPARSGRCSFDEVLIVDARASLRPAQLVERKLMSLLKSVYLPVSHVRTTALANRRGQVPVPAAQPEHRLGISSGASAASENKSQTTASLCCFS